MKTLLMICIAIVMITTTKAQDTIILKNGDEIAAKVMEVNLSDIKYKKSDNPDGPSYTIQKSEVFMIKYKNGSKDVINDASIENKAVPEAAPSPAYSGDMFEKGKADSRLYYNGYKGAGTGTFVTTLLFGGFGLVPAIACSSTLPTITIYNIQAAS